MDEKVFMDYSERISELLRNGEGLGVEFKRCSASVEQLGSGVKNLYKFARAYGGSAPTFQDGDIFMTSVSLTKLNDLNGDEVGTISPEVGTISPEVGTISPEVGTISPEVGTISPEVGTISPEVGTISPEVGTNHPEVGTNADRLSDEPLIGFRSDLAGTAQRVLNAIRDDPSLTIRKLAAQLHVAVSTVQNAVRVLKATGLLRKSGKTRASAWIIAKAPRENHEQVIQAEKLSRKVTT